MSKTSRGMVIEMLLLVTAILVMTIIVIIMMVGGSTIGDIIVSGGGELAGLKCVDTELGHSVFADVQPMARVNVITVNFIDDDLSSTMYRYEGTYKSE